MDALLPVTLTEQIDAVQAQRDYLARSAQWRAARRGFSRAQHARDLERLDAAIASLRRLLEIGRAALDAMDNG